VGLVDLPFDSELMRRAGLCLLTAAFAACVSGTATRNPTPPAQDWQVYSWLETGVAIALPPSWRTFDLANQHDVVFDLLVQQGTDQQMATAALDELAKLGGRFVAIGPLPRAGAAFAYAVYSAKPAEGRDSYVASQPQAPGRKVVMTEHLNGNAGDVLHQRVDTAATPQAPAMLQEQFFVERFDRLYVLFIQYQKTAGAEFSARMTLVGQTFTPTR
jgi:hypothetical protein